MQINNYLDDYKNKLLFNILSKYNVNYDIIKKINSYNKDDNLTLIMYYRESALIKKYTNVTKLLPYNSRTYYLLMYCDDSDDNINCLIKMFNNSVYINAPPNKMYNYAYKISLFSYVFDNYINHRSFTEFKKIVDKRVKIIDKFTNLLKFCNKRKINISFIDDIINYFKYKCNNHDVYDIKIANKYQVKLIKYLDSINKFKKYTYKQYVSPVFYIYDNYIIFICKYKKYYMINYFTQFDNNTFTKLSLYIKQLLLKLYITLE